MAKRPASVTNIICRLADRGDGGAGGPANSRPPVIDLANNRWRSNFIWPMRLEPYGSKFPNKTGLHLRHGYRGRSGPVLPPGLAGIGAPGSVLEHDPEKWEPVFRKDHAQTKR